MRASLVLPLLLASLPALGDTRPSLCLAGEAAVFSCATGGKIASLCASAEIGPGRGSLTYRFGRKGAVELTHPAAPLPPDQAFSAAVVGDAGSAGDILRFSRGEIGYTLYSIIVKGRGEREGVLVTRNGTRLADLPCKGTALGSDGWQRVYRARLPKAEPAWLP
ncbi:hypothetical protein [Bosea sp. CS1GBMeth4]|uniref:hypothetical protein n=1 Tax=Bosea sp. CS1GBMeth4 TaxID=1892849 RepID=UPI001645D3F1|nr:hypothetical protein [Bosea sp. CS1GBMeth4]